MDELLAAGLVGVGFVGRFKDMRVLDVTGKGRDFLHSRTDTDLNWAASVAASTRWKLTPEELRMFERLRKLRWGLAEGLPAFTVCSDQVLVRLATEKPLDLEALLAIKGVGPRFAEKYGQEFLKSLHDGAK